MNKTHDVILVANTRIKYKELTEYKRSAFVSGTTSPYPSVDNVATAQYTEAMYKEPLSTGRMLPSGSTFFS